MYSLDRMRILVTGGTGSLGQPLVRRFLKEDIKKIIVFSRDEHKQVEMERKFTDSRIRFLLGDIRDKNRLKRAFEGINVVVHCAALKHVHKCERDPIEAKKTNVDGAENIIEAAIDCQVKKVLAISTDKAVNPSCSYGKAKALADDLFVRANQYGNTLFSVIRFGNFVGSRGSVLPLFKKRKSLGLPLEITHPDMTRFFITFSDAVERVIEVILNMRGGEIFYPKMKSLKIKDLADAIDLGRKKLIGINKGEKIHEDLIVPSGAYKTYEIDNFFFTCENNRKDASRMWNGFYCNSENNKWKFTQKEIKNLIALS